MQLWKNILGYQVIKHKIRTTTHAQPHPNLRSQTSAPIAQKHGVKMVWPFDSMVAWGYAIVNNEGYHRARLYFEMKAPLLTHKEVL